MLSESDCGSVVTTLQYTVYTYLYFAKAKSTLSTKHRVQTVKFVSYHLHFRIRRDRLGWMLCDKDAAGHSRSAVRQMFVAGECFFARLEYFGEEGEWGAYVTGNNVAHDFRVRMRMSSTTRLGMFGFRSSDGQMLRNSC